MADSGYEEILASQLHSGVQALRERRWADARDALVAVANDPELEAAEGLRDIRGRALTLLCQALIELEDLDEAEVWLERANTVVTLEHGLETAVRELRDRLTGSRAAQTRAAAATARAQRLAEAPMEALLALPITSRVDHLLARANGLHENDPTEAARTARVALEHAIDDRGRVFSHLTLARVEPTTAAGSILAAHALADRSSNTALITAVCKAAEVAGVLLPAQHGPAMTRDTP